MNAIPDHARIEDALARGLSSAATGGGAVAMVQGDHSRVFLYGQARPGLPVSASTPFHVCSCSKTFAAVVFSRLVQDGMARWDDPVVGVVPEFMLSDAAATAQCTFRDLASMRVGLTRDGIAEWGLRQDLPRESRLARARHMEFAVPFRQAFSYSNLCYIALSLAAERLAGKSFATLVQDLICQPLDMLDSYSAGFGVAPAADLAIPCLPIDGKAVHVRDLTGPNSEGSARLHMSARDAVLWMEFLLSALAGSDAGPLSSASARAMIVPHATVGESDARLCLQPGDGSAYGLGLFVSRQQDQVLLRHGGGGRGWRHAMALLPEAHLGVMVMASAESPLIDALALQVLDALCGRTPFDWAGTFTRAAEAAALARWELLARAFPADPEAAPQALPEGCFGNAVTGDVQLESDGADVRMTPQDAPDFRARLRSLGGAVYEMVFDEPALTPQPLDPPFRLKLVRSGALPMLETSCFGSLTSVS